MSFVDSEDDELFIDVEEDHHHRCHRGAASLTSAGSVASNTTVLSLQAMVDAVMVDCSASVASPSSSSVRSSRSVVVTSSTSSSPARCSPTCLHRHDSEDASPTSPAAEKAAASGQSSCDKSPCCGAAGRRRLPDVVQLPSAIVCAEPRSRRRSFLIEEILRPDFGRRRPTTHRPQKQFPAEVGCVNHVTSIWQPFAASPSRPVADNQRAVSTSGQLMAGTTTNSRTGGCANKPAKRKSRAGNGGQTAVSSASVNKSTDRLRRVCLDSVQTSSRSSSASSSSSSTESGNDVSTARTESPESNVTGTQAAATQSKFGQLALPAWVYCTRYSDRPSSGPRSRKSTHRQCNASSGSPTAGLTAATGEGSGSSSEDKRPRTAFNGDQLAVLRREFDASRYLTEERRQRLAAQLGLHESQIKIWFQNKRAKLKKASGVPNPLALELMAQGLYNHCTMSSKQTATAATAAAKSPSAD